MNCIKKDDEIYAILVSNNTIQEGTEWIGSQFESLQASRMKYPKGKSFRVHHHILNPRTIKRTQECFIVINGKIAVDVYDKTSLLGTLEASNGEAIFVYRGGHGVRILENSLLYEVKAGSYTYVSEDKEFMSDKSF